MEEDKDIDEYNKKIDEENKKIEDDNLIVGNENKRNSLYAIGSIVAIVSVLMIMIFADDIGFDADGIPIGFTDADKIISSTHVSQYECEGYQQEAKLLKLKNSPETDITKWSEHDRTIALQIEKNYQLRCLVEKADVIDNFKYCTETYITINELLDKMVDMEVNSLSNDEQSLYQSSYNSYFLANCDLLQDDIIAQIDIWKSEGIDVLNMNINP